MVKNPAYLPKLAIKVGRSPALDSGTFFSGTSGIRSTSPTPLSRAPCVQLGCSEQDGDTMVDGDTFRACYSVCIAKAMADVTIASWPQFGSRATVVVHGDVIARLIYEARHFPAVTATSSPFNQTRRV